MTVIANCCVRNCSQVEIRGLRITLAQEFSDSRILTHSEVYLQDGGAVLCSVQ